MDQFGDAKHLPDLVEDLGLVPLADLHAVLHGRDDVLCPVLTATAGALLCRSWGKREQCEESNRGLWLSVEDL